MNRPKTTKKEKNPRENANILSIATYFYTIPTFLKGFKKDFEEDDLYETYSGHKSNTLGNKIEKLWIKEVERSKSTNNKPSIKRVLLKCFGIDLLCNGLILFFNEMVVKTCQILALGQLVSFYMNEESNINDAYFYAAKIIFCSFFAMIIGNPTSMSSYHIGIRMRVACCSLLYRKAVKLSKVAFEKTTNGQIVNLISNDTKGFDRFTQSLNYLWIAPIQTIFLGYFMYQEVGYCSIFGVVFLLLFIPLNFYNGKILYTYRTKSSLRTDERIRLMNEIIRGIPIIKMYTWEKYFTKLIEMYRKVEMKLIKRLSYIKGIYTACIVLNGKIAVFLTLMAYVLIYNNINARQVFVLTGLYNLLRQTMTVFFSNAVSTAAETNVCLKRITNFLLLEEVSQTYQDIDVGVEKNAITARIISAKWSAQSLPCLTNLNTNIRLGSLTTVIGYVGSGKSSFLNAILKELPIVDGDVSVRGQVSYCCQEPWLFNESIQQNILFGSDFDLQRYQDVVEACALRDDFQSFPHSDLTIVTDRGSSLSGGQKSRVNLARAAYKDVDVYLLDDPLSAVDGHVGKKIFDDCIKTYLKGKTVVLVTHQLQYLNESDNIIVLNNGSVIAQGSPVELQSYGFDFTKFLKEELSKVENKNKKVESTITSNKKKEVPRLAQEQNVTGSISKTVYTEYIKSGTNWCLFTILLVLFLSFQVVTSGGEYFLAYWVIIEQNEEKRNSVESNRLRYVCLISYSSLMILLLALSVARSLAFIEACIRASINLHNDMFQNIIRAPLRFFNLNSHGRILNRFSKDIGTIDELLPVSIADTVSIGLAVLGIVVVTSIVHVWLMVPVLVMLVIFYFLRVFYIGTSRSIKRLESSTKSPVIAHLAASLQGLTTIRAAKAQSLLINEFDDHQDLNTCASFLFLATSKAFGFWLDLCCTIYIMIVTLSSFLSQTEKYGGNVGLIISQALMLTGVFQWGMRQATELENQMTSVERVLEYKNVETENLNDQSQNISKSWPQSGKIEFVNVSVKYLEDSQPVIKKVCFKIEPLQKIGIVGRTGAGKSSLIQALFRLADIEGTIIIDDIDVKNISLHQLRSKISIIPQEPVLFSGSIRKNLDPLDQFNDDAIWKALEVVELKTTVEKLISGLHSEISEGGSNLSIGQRQLVCLARALLRNNKILVLDEATSNIDHVTDSLIQNVIRKHFTHCTVLTIAHRLNTVIDCDKILVMDSGHVVEFNRPYLLLQNNKGTFYKMVLENGRTMFETLMEIAKNNDDKLNSID